MNIPKQKISLKEKLIRYSLFTFFSSFFLISLTILAATYYPSVQPSGQILGGKFKAYFDLIFSDCNTKMGTSGYAIRGISSTSGLICEGIPVNCIGSWSNTSTCSKPCDGGVLQQIYTITTSSVFGGTSCPYTSNYQMVNHFL